MINGLLPQVLSSLGIDKAKGEKLIATLERTAAHIQALARAQMVSLGAIGDGRGIEPHNPLDTARAQSGTIAAGESVTIKASELVRRDYGTVARVHNRDIASAGGEATLIVRGMDEETYSVPLDPGVVEDLTGEAWKEITIKAAAGGSSVAYVVKAR